MTYECAVGAVQVLQEGLEKKRALAFPPFVQFRVRLRMTYECAVGAVQVLQAEQERKRAIGLVGTWRWIP
jgi:hypothetical protein